MTEYEQVVYLLSLCSKEQRRKIFRILRSEFSIHPIEEKLNIQAEIILEAIDRSSDLTLRGIRGVIAEAAFEINVINKLTNWRIVPLKGNFPYDFLIEDEIGPVRIQLKMQRLKNHLPMSANQAYTNLASDKFVVETQRTRGGMNAKTGENTRPYRFGDFDILAVSLQPSTKNWNSFMYTVADWLIARPENANLMLKFQPVSQKPSDDWTDDLVTSISWFRSGEKKKLHY